MINTDALKMAQKSEIAINDIASGLVACDHHTPVIVLMHEDRAFLAEQLRYVKRELERRGLAVRVESVNAVEAWLGTLPGHTFPNMCHPLVHILNLADLLPLTGLRSGLCECPCDLHPTGSPPLMYTVMTGATLFRPNLRVGDMGHSLAFGPTDAGKSTPLVTMHAQFRRYRSRRRRDDSRVPASITTLDKGRSLYTLCKATGSVYYDIGNDEPDAPALTLLVDIDSGFEALWAGEQITTCCELQASKPPTPQQKAETHRAMDLLHEAPREFRSLTDYVSTMQDSDMCGTLNRYTIFGSTGHLPDGEEGELKTSTYTVYEIDDLMKMSNNNIIPVLLYLFCRFGCSFTNQPAMLSFDEA